jgi:uncharacterized protein YbjT (DUF2867 family)
MAHLFIVGGNGVLGSATAKFFLKGGFNVSILVRDVNKAADLRKAGAKVHVGNITNPEDVKNIFNGADVVLAAVHGLLGRGKNKSENVDDAGHRRMIDEAKNSGVKQFIYTSAINASENHPIDFFQYKYKIEQCLINSGLKYTILRLPAFMEWHAFNLLGKSIVDKGKVTIFGKGTNPINFIAVKDIVAALDRMVLNKEYYNKTITLGGPDNLSRNEVAERFGEILKIKPKIGHVTPGALKVFAVLLQPLHPGYSRIMKYTLYSENVNETLDENLTVARFGLKPTTLDEFIHTIITKSTE